MDFARVGLRTTLRHFGTPDFVLTYVSVVRAAPGHAQQALHADKTLGRQHVEVHWPLLDFGYDRGPTLFCPCTQEVCSGKDDSPTCAAGTFRRRYSAHLTPCVHLEELHYGRRVNAMGGVTLYDASVWHGGLPNVGDTERPVLVPGDLAARVPFVRT